MTFQSFARTIFAASFLSLFVFTAAHGAAAGTVASGHVQASEAQAAYGKLPLGFEPNHGQTDSSVSYVSHGSEYTMFLSPREVTLSMHSAIKSMLKPGEVEKNDGWRAAVKMRLAGANSDATMTAEERLPGVSSYILGKDSTRWQTALPTFAKARAVGVYPGVDVVYYGTEGHLEYDFVLAAGADASRIRMQFDGATPVIDEKGDLVLPIGKDAGTMRLHRPELYQGSGEGRQAVDGRFVISQNHEVRFEVGAYDHSRVLTIDPYVEYSSFLGGSTQDTRITGMTVDAAGAMYVTGTTYALDYPTTMGVLLAACPAGEDPTTKKCGVSSPGVAFAAKIAPGGQSLVYSTYLGGNGPNVGGTGADSGGYIAVDANGNAWLAGQTVSVNFPTTPDAIQLYCSPVAIGFSFQANSYFGLTSGCYHDLGSGYYGYGSPDVFIAELNPTGTAILYGSFLGGYAYEEPVGIGLTAGGNVYVAGNTQSSTAQGGNNALTGGYYVWDVQDGVYLFPTTRNAYAVYGNYAANATVPFITVLNSDHKSVAYSTTIWNGTSYACQNGDCGDVTAQAMAVGSNGLVTITGHTSFNFFPVTANAVRKTCDLAHDHICNAELGFITTVNPFAQSGSSLVYSSFIGGTTPGPNFATHVTAVAINAAGDVIAAGDTQHSDFPTTAGAFQTTCATRSAAQCGTGFVMKISAAGALSWSTFFGSPTGSGGQWGVSALALDPAGNVYIANLADGVPDVPMKNNLMAQTPGNAYVAELSADGKSQLFGTYYGAGGNVLPKALFADSAQNIYMAGYAQNLLPLVHAYQQTPSSGFNEGFFTKIVTQLVNAMAAVTAVPSPAPGGGQVTLTATLTGPALAPTATGTVTFKNGTAMLGTGTLNNGGVATFSSVLPGGTYSVTAVYPGDSVYNAATSVATALTVAKTASNTTLTTSAANVGTAASVTLTATVTTGATGTVTFYNGSTSLGTGAVGTNGKAALATAFATAGTYSLTATYGGDNSFGGSTSAAVSEVVVVPGFTVTANPSSLTIQHGSTGTTTLTITPQGGYAGTITLSCGTLPSFATCIFNPASVTLAAGGGAVTDTLTIGTGTAQALMKKPSAGGSSSAAELALLIPGSLLGVFAFARKRNLSVALCLTVAALICFAGLGAMSGCGGSAPVSSTTTPAGTYPLTVTLTGTSAAAQPVNLTVVVQ